MKELAGRVGRFFLVYVIPFVAIGSADRLPLMQGLMGPVLLVGLAWMFAFHFLTKNWQPTDRNEDAS